MDTLIGFGVVLAAMALVIIPHEFGHYFALRSSGLIPRTFSVGFGPRLFSAVDSRGTAWRISLLPLGGFVDTANIQESLKALPYPRRVVFYAAGIAANFVLGVACITLANVLVGRGLLVSFEYGLHLVGVIVATTYAALWHLLTGHTEVLADFSGPVGLGTAGVQVARKGFGDVVGFLGILQIGIGAVNLLPLPVLDGGHIARDTVVALVPPRWRPALAPWGHMLSSLVMGVGIALLLTIFISTTWHDVGNLRH